MEKQLKCVLLLSLKEMTLRIVAATLWSNSDILASLPRGGLYVKEYPKSIEDTIKGQMLKLELPESLTKQIIDIVRSISYEVSAWKIHQLYFFRTLQKPDSVKLCWTTAGTIDYRRTAEELVRCDKFDVKQRYELACYYCFEDYISLYWEKLPQEEKGNYGNVESVLESLPACWSYILKGERTKLDYLARKLNRNLTSFNQFAFEDSAKRRIKATTEYFFQKLTPIEREVSLMRTACAVIEDDHMKHNFPEEKHSDLLCYLLSVMTPEQQMETTKSHPIEVFSCFLHWPLQDLFLDNAGLLWTFLPPSTYTALLKKVIHTFGCLNTYFPKTLKKFFKESPRDFKEWFVTEEYAHSPFTPASDFLYAFFDDGDSESIEVMFRNLEAADRVKLVFGENILEFFYDSMSKCRGHLVEVCLREATLSKEEKGRLKDAFKRQFGRSALFDREYVCRQFFQLLDKTDASSDKREKGQKRKLENGSPE